MVVAGAVAVAVVVAVGPGRRKLREFAKARKGEGGGRGGRAVQNTHGVNDRGRGRSEAINTIANVVMAAVVEPQQSRS